VPDGAPAPAPARRRPRRPGSRTRTAANVRAGDRQPAQRAADARRLGADRCPCPAGRTARRAGRDGDWLRVTLVVGSAGWVSARYVRAEARCAADKPGAELLSDVPLSVGGGAIGAVVIEATVDASGRVVATRVVRDSTGAPELVKESYRRQDRACPERAHSARVGEAIPSPTVRLTALHALRYRHGPLAPPRAGLGDLAMTARAPPFERKVVGQRRHRGGGATGAGATRSAARRYPGEAAPRTSSARR
jgi:hypothetical protein